MTIKWTESATVKLVVLYAKYECLCNPFHQVVNKELCCYKAYKEIVNCMNIPGLTVCDCVKRISFVKKQYCFELSKISSAISRGSFYKPKAIWFEMMHELLFPYIQSEPECNEDSRKDCDCSQDEEGNGDRCGYENQTIDECECPPCECPASENLEPEPEPRADIETFSEFSPKKYHRSKSRVSKNRSTSKSPMRFIGSSYLDINSAVDLKRLNFKPNKFTRCGKPFDQIDYGTNTKKATSDKWNEIIELPSCTKSAQVSKKRIDISSRTNSPNHVNQIGAQTEGKATTNTYTSFDQPEKTESTVNFELTAENVSVDSAEDNSKKYNHHDEFDMFGKSIAFQLRSLNLESAINLEKRIQDMMTEERLFRMNKDTVTVKSCSKECTRNYNNCEECCNLQADKERTCVCGLPVNKCLPLFPFKTDQCYGFGCN